MKDIWKEICQEMDYKVWLVLGALILVLICLAIGVTQSIRLSEEYINKMNQCPLNFNHLE